MRYEKRVVTVAGMLAGLIALAGFTTLDTGSGERVHRIDFGKVRTPVKPTYQAELAPVNDAPIKEFRIPITHESIEIADGVQYDGWTFGGTVPGPALRVRQGDLVRIQLVNESPMPHSIDLHSARIPMNEAFRILAPGDSLAFEFVARDPGAYLVHCGTPPVMMHIMQGMYMAIIVDPADGWGSDVDEEFVLVQSEFYARPGSDNGSRIPDYRAAGEKDASYVVFNGKAFQYKQSPLEVQEGNRVRLFVVNAGPSLRSDFHIVGAIFDRVLPSGDPHAALERIQTWSVPAGGGAVFETAFARNGSGEGTYAFVTHAFADAEKGAVGLITVAAPQMMASR